jgi:hypothetical protein
VHNNLAGPLKFISTIRGWHHSKLKYAAFTDNQQRRGLAQFHKHIAAWRVLRQRFQFFPSA